MLSLIHALALLALASPASAVTATDLRARVRSGLEFLREHQSDGKDGYDPGQWHAEVVSTLPDSIGIGKHGVPYEEPSDFVAASVANALAETYFLDPSYDAVPGMIDRAEAGLGPYRWGPVFHFYPPATFHGKAVRAPRYMYLDPEWRGFTNTPPDADSTSVSYLLGGYARAIHEGKDPLHAGFSIPEAAVQTFARFRDVGREPHVFNAENGDRNTGGYLTWLWDENDPTMPRDFSAPPDAGTRIPFGRNDVDCVVNANVIKALTVAGGQGAPGYREACDYLNGIAAREELYTCGMYYPSEYVLPYAMAAALDLGASCLEPSKAELLVLVTAQQLKNGSWTNAWANSRPDYVQSTAWALNTLLLLGDPGDPAQRKAALRGAAYLLSRARRDRHGHVYWDGEIFYAATYVSREGIVWRSTPYTTATALKALAGADRKWHLF